MAEDITGGGVVDMAAALTTLQEWSRVSRQLDELKKREAELRGRVREFMVKVGASEGRIGEAKVLEFKPKNAFAEAQFRKARPDLVEHFETTVEKRVIDVTSLKKAHPDVYAEFQTKDLRPDHDAILAAAQV